MSRNHFIVFEERDRLTCCDESEIVDMDKTHLIRHFYDTKMTTTGQKNMHLYAIKQYIIYFESPDSSVLAENLQHV